MTKSLVERTLANHREDLLARARKVVEEPSSENLARAIPDIAPGGTIFKAAGKTVKIIIAGKGTLEYLQKVKRAIALSKEALTTIEDRQLRGARGVGETLNFLAKKMRVRTVQDLGEVYIPYFDDVFRRGRNARIDIVLENAYVEAKYASKEMSLTPGPYKPSAMAAKYHGKEYWIFVWGEVTTKDHTEFIESLKGKVPGLKVRLWIKGEESIPSSILVREALGLQIKPSESLRRSSKESIGKREIRYLEL